MGDGQTEVAGLTERQKEILRLVSQQMQGKEIARLLKITERTVKAHTESARKRLGVMTSRDAARVLVAHESQSLPASPMPERQIPGGQPPVLEGQWPARPVVSPVPDLSASDHDQTIPTLQSPRHDHQLEPHGNSDADDGGTRQTVGRDRHDRRDSETLSERGAREGGVFPVRGDSLANGGIDWVRRRLKSLNAVQWFLVTLFAAVAIPFVTTVGIATVMIAFQAIYQLKHLAG